MFENTLGVCILQIKDLNSCQLHTFLKTTFIQIQIKTSQKVIFNYYFSSYFLLTFRCQLFLTDREKSLKLLVKWSSKKKMKTSFLLNLNFRHSVYSNCVIYRECLERMKIWIGRSTIEGSCILQKKALNYDDCQDRNKDNSLLSKENKTALLICLLVNVITLIYHLMKLRVNKFVLPRSNVCTRRREVK